MNYIELFENQEHELVSKMKEINHGYQNQTYNPYHMEGSIWNHTKMVYKEAERYSSMIRLIALLHDVGKVFTFKDNDKTKRRSFYNHESISVYHIMRFLKSLNLTNNDIKDIVTLVSAHTLFHDITKENIDKYVNRYGKEIVKLGLIFNDCDRRGRITKENIDKTNITFDDVDNVKPKISTMNLKSTLTLLIGPPGSGKSTFVKDNIPFMTSIISRDKYVEEIGRGDNYTQKFQSLSRDEHHKIDKMLMKDYVIALKNNRDIVIDMTNMSRKSRKKFLNGYEQLKDYQKHAIVFLTDIDTMIERRSGNKTIPKEVIYNMINQFTMPGLDEFDKVTLKITS